MIVFSVENVKFINLLHRYTIQLHYERRVFHMHGKLSKLMAKEGYEIPKRQHGLYCRIQEIRNVSVWKWGMFSKLTLEMFRVIKEQNTALYFIMYVLLCAVSACIHVPLTRNHGIEILQYILYKTQWLISKC